MSDANGNGAPSGDSLKRAFGILRGAIKKVEHKARRIHKSGFMYGPRQFCAVCGNTFDMAMIDPKVTMTKAICSRCKALLAEGYTACITSEKFAFVKSPHLKATGMSGKIVPVSDEIYAKIQETKNVPRPPIQPT